MPIGARLQLVRRMVEGRLRLNEHVFSHRLHNVSNHGYVPVLAGHLSQLPEIDDPV
ncbi:hypothetical protein D3C83_315910 [compost metagenome]